MQEHEIRRSRSRAGSQPPSGSPRAHSRHPPVRPEGDAPYTKVQDKRFVNARVPFTSGGWHRHSIGRRRSTRGCHNRAGYQQVRGREQARRRRQHRLGIRRALRSRSGSPSYDQRTGGLAVNKLPVRQSRSARSPTSRRCATCSIRKDAASVSAPWWWRASPRIRRSRTVHGDDRVRQGRSGKLTFGTMPGRRQHRHIWRASCAKDARTPASTCTPRGLDARGLRQAMTDVSRGPHRHELRRHGLENCWLARAGPAPGACRT